MKSETFSSLEAIFLTKFNEGHKTFESLKNNIKEYNDLIDEEDEDDI